MTDQQKQDLEKEKNKDTIQNKEGQGKKNKNKDKDIIELDFSKCDFPIAYSEQRLVDNWYEFNDSTVVPIQRGVL